MQKITGKDVEGKKKIPVYVMDYKIRKMFDMTFPNGILNDFSFGLEHISRNEPIRRFRSWHRDQFGSFHQGEYDN